MERAPDTPIENEGFEEATQQDAPNGWQYLPDGWEGYQTKQSKVQQEMEYLVLKTFLKPMMATLQSKDLGSL